MLIKDNVLVSVKRNDIKNGKFIVSNSVTKIGNNAFYDCCDFLESIFIPSGVVEIDWYAFSGCYKLKELNMSNGLKVIGEGAFSSCQALTKINIPDTVERIDDNAFQWCNGLTELNIPNSVISIGNSSFNGCRSLKKINMSDSVITIGYGAFELCEKLEKIIIPESVTTIGEYAFSGCSTLREVVIPKGVKIIGDEAFSNCKKLEKVIIPESVTVIGGSAFSNCESLKEITIPKGVKTIKTSAFELCEKLEKIIIPESVTTIGEYAFSGCSTLKEVIIPESVTTMGDHAFSDCTRLKKITIHEGVTTIGNFVFDGCDNLKEVIIPEGVNAIGSYAFGDCNKLEKVTIPKSVATIEYSAFSGCSSLKELILPKSVTTIDNYVFYNCKSLKELILPEKLITIGKGLFQDCVNLEKVIIPEGVKVIKDFAFSNCPSLKEIIIPESVVTISKYIFTPCIHLEGKNLGHYCYNLNLTLKSSLVNLKENSFDAIKSLTIYNYKFEDIELAMDKLNEIREEELQDKINFALLDNYILDDKCFKYIEHKKFINKIINNIETKENYDYRIDFDNYINNYVNEHKPKELVEVKNIQSMLIDINNYKVDNLSLDNSVQIEQYGIELLDYSLYITSLLSKLQTNPISNIETINLNKILSKITKLESRNNDGISKLVEKVFFDVSEEGLVLNKTLINKIISYTRYKVCSLKDEINGFEILKEIIRVCLEKINVCKENLSNIEIIDERNIRLLNIDKGSMKNNANTKIDAFNNCELMLSSLYEQINNLTTLNQIHIDKLKELVTHVLPSLLQKTTSGKVVLKDKEDVEVLNTVCDTLRKLIKLEESSKIETNSLETKEEKKYKK